MPLEIITANRLGDGRVVFQTADGWSVDIRHAQGLDDKAAVEAALARANADAAANRVVEPYAIGVARADDRLVPTRLRERIRAEGPTTGNSRKRQGTEAALGAGDPPPPCGEGLGEGSSMPSSTVSDPSPSPLRGLPSPHKGERVYPRNSAGAEP